MKAVQFFSKQYLAECRKLKTDEILEFIEEYRNLHTRASRSRLISLKVPEPLLQSFKMKSQLHGVPYQTQIKRLMEKWLTGGK